LKERAVEEASRDAEVSGFITLYARQVKVWVWMERRGASATIWDKQRTFALERRVSALWASMAPGQRKLATEALLAQGSVPAVVREVLAVFGGELCL
jgi:hypothetical protein